MELEKEYILYQYQELGMLEGNANVKIVRNSITGKIAVKKDMGIEQLPVYAFLKSHNNDFLPEIYECLENGQHLTIIEEYIEGRNLEDVLSEQEMTEREACRLVKELCRALAPLHTASPAIVCRDLKPENIILTLDGHVKIIDFNIARIVTPGKSRDTTVMGTEGFAAPEQFGHCQTDGRSDIYALGILLNYLILHKYPVERMVDGGLRKIVQKCIAMNPDQRYQTVKELETALEKQYPSRSEPVKTAGKESPHKRKREWREYLPPGFRSGSIWKMAAAFLGYYMIIDAGFSMDVEENGILLTGIKALPQHLAVVFSQLTEVCFIFNYLGCREKTPLLNSQSRARRILGYILLEFVLFIIVSAFWTISETLHSHNMDLPASVSAWLSVFSNP